MDPKAQLNPGDDAPDFTLASTLGRVILGSLCSQSQRGVILYFYPKASMPGCTTQACDFRDTLDSFTGSGYVVVGISPDKMPALEKFRNEHQLTFALASDLDHKVAEAYGAWGEKQNYGKTYEGLIRSTIVINPQGKITHAQYNVKAKGHVERLRRELGLDDE